MSPEIYPTQNKICVLHELAGAPSIKRCASLGRMSVADTSIRLAKWGGAHRGKSVNLVSWLQKKKSLKDKCNILKAQRVTESADLIVSRCLKKHSFSNSWRRLVSTQVFLLAVVASTNRLPPVVPPVTARLEVQSSVFSLDREEWGLTAVIAELVPLFLGRKENYFAIKDFWETISNRWCYYSLPLQLEMMLELGRRNFKKTFKKKNGYFVFWPWGLLSPISLPGLTMCPIGCWGSTFPLNHPFLDLVTLSTALKSKRVLCKK